MSVRKIIALLAVSLTAVAGVALYVGTASAARQGRGSVTMTVQSGTLDVLAAPCGGRPLVVDLANSGSQGAYVDVFITPERPLVTSHDVISTYVPPNDNVVLRAQVSAPLGSAGGTHDVSLRLGPRGPRQEAAVTVTPKPSGPGANLALGGPVSASSTHGNFHVCGGVDGNANSDDWSTRTGWNDGTRAVFPDTYTVAFGGPQPIDRIVLYTLDSVRYPAARNGLRDFDVQVLGNGGEWTTVSRVRGNTKGRLEFSPDPVVSTTSVRVVALASNSGDYSRIVELEVYQDS
ncbi:galactose-binding domain-containing protein [Actinomadura rudentiformis]|uniref:Discoidin domain-containing protein n=1 Tax=Actinomadura rudentiformis TaxID=359158 RepID=A0A6H9YFJ5_9ACTN|nr:discoidin domain-containing protein [Actinomadura rudentiformis]KAB2340409.1 discoidin domain-containing protein [Actinomadura rudentiformis]